VRFRFILAEKANYPVVVMCRVLRVARSGFYAWARREPSVRDRQDRVALVRIRAVYRRHCGRYGSPRIHRELNTGPDAIGRHRIARLMRLDGLTARQKRRFRIAQHAQLNRRHARNRVRREFSVAQPNRIWLGDITYLRAADGWLFLSCFLDLHSRRVVGWTLDDKLDARATCDALKKAIQLRRPNAGLIVHSDRGAQYTGEDFQRVLRQHNFIASMSRKGNCWDNAPMESIFATLKRELAIRPTLISHEVRRLVADYIAYYNTERIHSALDYMTPTAYEKCVAV
jgi:transposase InsO family protein